MSPPRVAVVGGGISGLAAAHRLRRILGPAAQIILLERSIRLGGVLRTIELAGVPYDVGAEAFLSRRPEVADLLAELGRPDELVSPSRSAGASLRVTGRTVALPGGTVLGVPTSTAQLADVLSPAGLRRVADERAAALQWDRGGDRALGGLLRERFGDELTDRLVDPLLGGVYAGRVDALGLRPTMPTLAAALDAGAPSLTAAADRAAAGAASPESPWPPVPSALPVPSESPRPPASSALSASPASPAGDDRPAVFGALRAGYRVLLDALVAAAGADVRLGLPVRELQRRPEGWRLVLGPTTAPEALDVDAVVLAVPAPPLARLVAGVLPAAASAAAGVELASSAVVALAYRAADTEGLPESSGVLVATGEPLTAKAFTYSSRKWPHLAAGATDGLVRLRASIGRHGEAATLQVDDADLVRTVLADLAELTGIRACPVATHVQRWGGGLPQYGPGHLDRVQALERAVATQPGLAVAGALLHGVGVPACIASGQAAALRVADPRVAGMRVQDGSIARGGR